MTIECYNTSCPKHSYHDTPDEGPFCYEEVCVESLRPTGSAEDIVAAAREFFAWFNRSYAEPNGNEDHPWNVLGRLLTPKGPDDVPNP